MGPVAGLLSKSVPACYRDPVLVILEGDRLAPVKFARKAAAGGSSGTEMVSVSGCATEEVSRETARSEAL
eukprot:symbB.v1.2.040802.t1/scaffold7546.1/size10665/1